MAKQPKKATLKPTTRWVCINRRGHVLDFTVEETRKKSQDIYMSLSSAPRWFKEETEDYGVQCVKCRIVPFEGSRR